MAPKLTMDQQRQKDLDKAVRAGDQKEIKRLRSIIKSVQQNKAKSQPNPRNLKPSMKELKGVMSGNKEMAGDYGKARAAGNIPKTKVPTIVSKAEKAYAENLKKTGQEVPKKLKGMPRMGGEFTGPRKNVLKRMKFGGMVMNTTKAMPVDMMGGGKVRPMKMKMGGVIPGRGGSFKGVR